MSAGLIDIQNEVALNGEFVQRYNDLQEERSELERQVACGPVGGTDPEGVSQKKHEQVIADFTSQNTRLADENDSLRQQLKTAEARQKTEHDGQLRQKKLEFDKLKRELLDLETRLRECEARLVAAPSPTAQPAVEKPRDLELSSNESREQLALRGEEMKKRLIGNRRGKTTTAIKDFERVAGGLTPTAFARLAPNELVELVELLSGAVDSVERMNTLWNSDSIAALNKLPQAASGD